MGIVICEKHGKQGVKTNIDKKLINAILNDIKLESANFKEVEIKYYDESEYLYSEKFLLLEDTIIEEELVELYSVTNDEEEKVILPKLTKVVGSICGQCYTNYLLKDNLRTKK